MTSPFHALSDFEQRLHIYANFYEKLANITDRLIECKETVNEAKSKYPEHPTFQTFVKLFNEISMQCRMVRLDLETHRARLDDWDWKADLNSLNVPLEGSKVLFQELSALAKDYELPVPRPKNRHKFKPFRIKPTRPRARSSPTKLPSQS